MRKIGQICHSECRWAGKLNSVKFFMKYEEEEAPVEQINVDQYLVDAAQREEDRKKPMSTPLIEFIRAKKDKKKQARNERRKQENERRAERNAERKKQKQAERKEKQGRKVSPGLEFFSIF